MIPFQILNGNNLINYSLLSNAQFFNHFYHQFFNTKIKQLYKSESTHAIYFTKFLSNLCRNKLYL